ncbi:tyrosine-type recombinase/integrase [Microbacterium arthrosphaerae]|uniref:tyrosine-type recombinase/integrase n=1 Tax=Microbacterium TaxID=33882 RepID=UPI0035EDF2B7
MPPRVAAGPAPTSRAAKPDGQVLDIIEVLLGAALRIGECLALRVCDVEDGPSCMTISVTGTVVLRTGSGAVRQDHSKTELSIRRIAVPDFAAAVLRERLASIPISETQRTIFADRAGKPLSPFNVRRTFRAFLELADLGGRGLRFAGIGGRGRRYSRAGRAPMLPPRSRTRIDRDHRGALHRARPHRGSGAGRHSRADTAA